MDDTKRAGTGITILAWHPITSPSSLKGFADVAVEGWRLTIYGCTVHVRPEGSKWIGVPGKPVLGPDGKQQIDEATGKKRYVPSLQITDRDVSDRFNRAVLAALDLAHPGWSDPR